MSATSLALQRTNLENLAMLARLFERVERSATPVDAGQYRMLAARLGAALGAPMASGALDAVLAAHPATAELYENLHYAHAGLCRCPLEAAVAAETAAREVLMRLGLSRSSPSAAPAA